jgi:hypothetical protein
MAAAKPRSKLVGLWCPSHIFFLMVIAPSTSLSYPPLCSVPVGRVLVFLICHALVRERERGRELRLEGRYLSGEWGIERKRDYRYVSGDHSHFAWTTQLWHIGVHGALERLQKLDMACLAKRHGCHGLHHGGGIARWVCFSMCFSPFVCQNSHVSI